MSGMLIQVGTGAWRPVLDLVTPHHTEYARRHNMEFRPVGEALQRERHPIWDKVVAIREALQGGYDFVVALDADALVVRPEVDPRLALRWGELGFVCHQHPHQPFHANAGATYLKSTAAVRDFYEAVWDFPYRDDWDAAAVRLGTRDGEQHSVNRVLERTGWARAEILHAHWNSTPGINDTPAPIVRAWHGIDGIGERQQYMAAELARLNRDPEAASVELRDRLRDLGYYRHYYTQVCCGDMAPFLSAENYEYPRISWLRGQATGHRILDVGCGTGELAHMLRQLGRWVMGIDPSERHIAKANARYAAAHPHLGGYVQAFAEDYLALLQRAFGAAVQFDTVLCGDVLEHVPDPGAFLDVLRRLGRRVAVTTPLGAWPSAEHLHEFTLDDAAALAAPRCGAVEVIKDRKGRKRWLGLTMLGVD